ncbi:MAG: helix-turn-helix transcriptional regulator [Solirubrobacterales bacterium]|nr:helix-turn-helix transcriptional regulator [Solirubrobacterales bacterium]
MSDLSMGEAARALGVSVDTLRRWDGAGKLATTRDERNRRRVPAAEVERLGRRPRKRAAPATSSVRGSARNRMDGVVRSVEVDGVMALVEVQAGPFTLVAAVTRDAVEDLALEEGSPITAVIKSTMVTLEQGSTGHPMA